MTESQVRPTFVYYSHIRHTFFDGDDRDGDDGFSFQFIVVLSRSDPWRNCFHEEVHCTSLYLTNMETQKILYK